MECVDNTEKVKKMLKQYEHEKIINLIVIK
jgi:hypothetical protein